jgi:tetratricopeptide (TPR) repeat protein
MQTTGLTLTWPVGAWLDQAPERALAQVTQALEDALAGDDPVAAVQARLWQGQLQDWLGQADAASTLSLARREAERLGDPVLLAHVAIALARVDVDHARHADALAACQQVLAQARVLQAGPLIRRALFTTATSLCHIGEHDQAVETFEQARASLLADPAGRGPQPQVALARYAAGQAQAWLMRGGLLLEASGSDAARPALQQARDLGEQACRALAGASARHSHPALFTLIRVLLELSEGDRAREWLARVRHERLAAAAPGSLALAQEMLSESMIELRLGTDDLGAVLSRLRRVEHVKHPRVTQGDLRLSLLRCLFEACERAGRYRQALEYQQQWS